MLRGRQIVFENWKNSHNNGNGNFSFKKSMVGKTMFLNRDVKLVYHNNKRISVLREQNLNPIYSSHDFNLFELCIVNLMFFIRLISKRQTFI